MYELGPADLAGAIEWHACEDRATARAEDCECLERDDDPHRLARLFLVDFRSGDGMPELRAAMVRLIEERR